MDCEKAICYNRYRYSYYNNNKEYYKYNYLERKRRIELEKELGDYYLNYWRYCQWKKIANKYIDETVENCKEYFQE